MKAIILAGGKGTRLKPITDSVPKALVPLGDSTLIEIAINSLPDSIDTVIITTKYLGQLIQEKIGPEYAGKKILYAAQPAGSDGTWPAFYSAKEFIGDNEQFLVLNCDDLFKKEELMTVIESGKNGMGVTTTIMPAKYHCINISENGIVLGLQRHANENREELVEDTFANGLYLLDSSVFSFPAISLIDGETGLPQTLMSQSAIYPLYAHRMKYWQACNSLEDLENIKKSL
jgi:NDP-sugar pyrophosphorylase family protein